MNTYLKRGWGAGQREWVNWATGSGVVERQKDVDITSLLAHKKVMTFSSDELILALVSLVRATRPGMLRQEADGFSVDFEAIARGKAPGDADRLLLKMGAVMESSTPYPAENPNSSVSLDLDAAEARQIADALAKLELLQAWPEDVMDMSRALRARLLNQQ